MLFCSAQHKKSIYALQLIRFPFSYTHTHAHMCSLHKQYVDKLICPFSHKALLCFGFDFDSPTSPPSSPCALIKLRAEINVLRQFVKQQQLQRRRRRRIFAVLVFFLRDFMRDFLYESARQVFRLRHLTANNRIRSMVIDHLCNNLFIVIVAANHKDYPNNKRSRENLACDESSSTAAAMNAGSSNGGRTPPLMRSCSSPAVYGKFSLSKCRFNIYIDNLVS